MSTTSYEFHGYIFQITIEEENNKFLGQWKCQCGQTGNISRPCTTKESAIIATQSNAASHYGATHK